MSPTWHWWRPSLRDTSGLDRWWKMSMATRCIRHPSTHLSPVLIVHQISMALTSNSWKIWLNLAYIWKVSTSCFILVLTSSAVDKWYNAISVVEMIMINLSQTAVEARTVTDVFIFVNSFDTTSSSRSQSIMTSQRPSSNRTRNSTFPMPGMNSSRFNESDFDRNNSSRPGMMPVDESPEGMLYLLSALALPSICCFAFLFYNFLRLPELRSRSTNLTIICLLIINFVHVRSFLFSPDEVGTMPLI